ncbi:hypothetical protein BC829DRAFT_389880 [Chytridium lagenaria]|nr:hypothetical protein BC829DRAFT_389880 [Chytridium lagenaria]
MDTEEDDISPGSLLQRTYVDSLPLRIPEHACYIHLYLTSKIKLTEQREALSIWVFGTFRIRLSDRAISSSSGYRASIVNVNGDIRILDYVIGSSTGSVLIDVDEWRRRLESSGVLRFSICSALSNLENGPCHDIDFPGEPRLLAHRLRFYDQIKLQLTTAEREDRGPAVVDTTRFLEQLNCENPDPPCDDSDPEDEEDPSILQEPDCPTSPLLRHSFDTKFGLIRKAFTGALIWGDVLTRFENVEELLNPRPGQVTPWLTMCQDVFKDGVGPLLDNDIWWHKYNGHTENQFFLFMQTRILRSYSSRSSCFCSHLRLHLRVPVMSAMKLSASDYGGVYYKRKLLHLERASPASGFRMNDQSRHSVVMGWQGLELDRGHLFAQSYKSFNVPSQRATFSTWNMFPQAKEINRNDQHQRVIRSGFTDSLYLLAGVYVGTAAQGMERNAPFGPTNPLRRVWGYFISNDGAMLDVFSIVVHTLTFMRAKLGVSQFFNNCDFDVKTGGSHLSPSDWVRFWAGPSAPVFFTDSMNSPLNYDPRFGRAIFDKSIRSPISRRVEILDVNNSNIHLLLSYLYCRLIILLDKVYAMMDPDICDDIYNA